MGSSSLRCILALLLLCVACRLVHAQFADDESSPVVPSFVEKKHHRKPQPSKPTVNNWPVIGVIAQPTSKRDQELHGGEPGRCYIASSYVKWIEGSGARVLPIPYNVSEEVLDDYFDNVNGLLFTGGGCNVNQTKFFYSVMHLYDRAVEANLRGDYFPVWGICMGFQLLSILSSTPRSVDLLKKFDTLNYAINLDYTKEAEASRSFNFVGGNVLNTLNKRLTAFNNHAWGVLPSDYEADPKLKEIFKVISTSVDRQGAVFISTFEGRTLPFYATQWHPEKPLYEWQERLLIEHDYDTIVMGQSFGNFFIQEARKNFHELSERLESELIFAFTSTYTAPVGSEFENCYFFNSITWGNGPSENSKGSSKLIVDTEKHEPEAQ